MSASRQPASKASDLPILELYCTWTREDDGLPPRADGGCVHCGGQPDAEIHSYRRAVRVIARYALKKLQIIQGLGILPRNVPTTHRPLFLVPCVDCGDRDYHDPVRGCLWQGEDFGEVCECFVRRVAAPDCAPIGERP